MKPWDHQWEMASEAEVILKEHMIVYLAAEERTGKTLSAILLCEQIAVTDVLVVTKKKAIEGWTDTIHAYQPENNYTVINYHSLHKLEKTDYDIVILDESHNYISGYPKKSAIWQKVRRFTEAVPIIYISATPYAQTPALLYHQLALSSWSPWLKYKNFYDWHRIYGTGETQWIHGREIRCYNKVQDSKVLKECEHLFVTQTRKGLGFDHEPEDKVHYIENSCIDIWEWSEVVYNYVNNIEENI